MTDRGKTELQAKREYAQLLRMYDRVRTQLHRVREELSSSQTDTLLKDIRVRTGEAPDLSAIIGAVEEALRALKLSESATRDAMPEHHEPLAVDGAPNLPVHLQRFLAERAQDPGFSYEVRQDEVRGWMICWKEYTPKGTVRGYGQFYERPYAYLED